MRLFIVGMPGAGNLGDDLISVLLTKHVFERWPHAEIGILCGDHSIPFSYPKESRIRFLYTPNRRSIENYFGRINKIQRYLQSTNLILIGGGGLFQDSHYFFNVHKWLRYVLNIRFQNIPASIVGVGFGPFNYGFSKWYLRKALRRFSTIQVRDTESSKIVESLGYNSKLSTDIVSGTTLDQTPFSPNPNSEVSDCLGCSIRPWTDLGFNAVVDLIDKTVKENNLSCKLFVFEYYEPTNISEFTYAKRVADKLERRDVNVEVVCYRKHSLSEFSSKFTNVSKAIASRLHANILWQKLGVPTLPISYAPKIDRLYFESSGDVVSTKEVDGSKSSCYQQIELNEIYQLPEDEFLFEKVSFDEYYLYFLSSIVNLLETIYGIIRSVVWRIRKIV